MIGMTVMHAGLEVASTPLLVLHDFPGGVVGHACAFVMLWRTLEKRGLQSAGMGGDSLAAQ
jgi:hypothetical protein